MYKTAQFDFASGHFGKSLLWAGVESLGLYFLVSVHGISPAIAGTALFASMVWNALLDGFFGSSVGRGWIAPARLAWLNAAAIGIAGLAFALLPIAMPCGTWLPIALLFALRSAFSLLDVQHNLASAPLADAAGHLPMARVRSLLATLAAAVIAFAAAPMIYQADAGSLAPALLVTAVGLLSCLSMMRIPRLIRNLADHTPPGELVAGGVPPATMGYAVLAALGFAGIGAVPKALLQLEFTSGWQVAAVLPILTLARLAANPLSTRLAAQDGILPALRMALIGSGVTAMAMPLIGLHEIFDVVLIACFGIAAGAVAVLSWARLTEVLAFSGGRSCPVGNFTMVVKFGLGASALFTGLWLDRAGDGRGTVSAESLAPLCFAVLMCCVISAMLLGRRRDRVRPAQAECGA